MNLRCLIRGHQWVTIHRYNLVPKHDGALKLHLSDFTVSDNPAAPYTGEVKVCARCGKNTVEIL